MVKLYPIFAAFTPDNLGIELTLYNALIRTIQTYYAGPAWGHAVTSSISKLQVVQDKAIRIITKLLQVAPKLKIYAELNLQTVEWVHRLIIHETVRGNPLILGLDRYNAKKRRRQHVDQLGIIIRQEDREAGMIPRFWYSLLECGVRYR